MSEPILSASAIYSITNRVNGKVYVGSAVSLGRRWRHHRSSLRRNLNRSIYLQAAWNKYGEEAFDFNVIEYVDEAARLIEREQYWIDFLRSAVRGFGYNISPTAGSTLGIKLTDDARRKISLAGMGRRPTEETRQRLSAAQKGRQISLDQRKKIAASLTGRTIPADVRQRMGANNPLTGQRRSEEELNRRRITRAANGHTKLNAEAIRSIRSMCAQPNQMSAASRLFGVSVQTVSRIVHRIAWTHVED